MYYWESCVLMPCCALMGGYRASRYKPLCNIGWLCTNARLCTNGGLCTNGMLFRGGTLSASRRCLALRKLRCNTGGNAAGVLRHRPMELSQGWLCTHGVLCTHYDIFLNPCSCGLSCALECTLGWLCIHGALCTDVDTFLNPFWYGLSGALYCIPGGLCTHVWEGAAHTEPGPENSNAVASHQTVILALKLSF